MEPELIKMSTRRIVFTKNNWTEEDYRALWEEEKFSYLVMGKEVGENGTPHLQGYAEFHKKSKFAPLSKKYKMHCEVARGTQEEAIKYCQKDGDWAERGDKKGGSEVGGEVTKKKFEDAWELARQGRIGEIEEPLRTRYLNSYLKVQGMFGVKPDDLETIQNGWLWGPTGTGKSYHAREISKEYSVYYKSLNKWWDGYQREEVVIIEEWEKDCHLDHYLKVWADRYAFPAEVKGGRIFIRPKFIIVTSNYSIDECFEGEAREAIRRRFNVHHFDRLNKTT